ncbi:MAG TPA: hypothetical protein VFR91_06915 [Dyella sp.]|nr:hypothetical protein [Dyella sp.]
MRGNRFIVLVVAACALLPGTPCAQDTAWRRAQVAAAERSERIMATAMHRKNLLDEYRVMLDAAAKASPEDRAFNVIFSQYLSWFQTYVGDYPDAAISYSIAQPAQAGDAPSPLSGDWTPEPATQALARLVHGRQVVFFNEAHNIPLTRTLTVAMLPALRQEGFDYLAVETLYDDDTRLAQRGYPTAASGFYINEPIYGEMVRSALKLGFKVVAYESDQPGTPDERERGQAHNLYERIFRKDPKARVVVNAGYAHIQKSGRYLGGRSMAQYFQSITGIEPLSIEQTMMIPHPDPSSDHPWYAAVVHGKVPAVPFVFVDPQGRPWSLRPGYDASVFFPPVRMRRERPTWLDLLGLRRHMFVSGKTLCDNTWPCLVEALYANEGDDAVAADRVLFDPPPNPPPLHDRLRSLSGATQAELYLRPGDYRLRVTAGDQAPQVKQTLHVPPR